mgnify:FL=1
MIKLLPGAVDVPTALATVHRTAHLLSEAPVKQYHRALVGALAHLEAQLSPESLIHVELPSAGLGELSSRWLLRVAS